MKNFIQSKQFRNHLVPFLILLLMSLIVNGANPFKGETVAPLDLLMRHNGWASVRADLDYSNENINHYRSDLIDARYPRLVFYKKALWNFTIPNWNPNTNTPITENLANMLLEPRNLAFMLIKNDGLGIYVGGILQLMISAMGMYYLLRLFLGKTSSIFGGGAFMLTGFNIAWYFNLSVSIWFPWIFLATLQYLRNDDKKWLWALTAFSFLMIYSRFYSVAGYGFYAVGLLILIWNGFVHKNKKEMWIKSAWPFLFIFFAFLLSISNFYTMLEFLSRADLSYRGSPKPLPASKLNGIWHSISHPEFSLFPGRPAVLLSVFSPFIIFWQRKKIVSELLIFWFVSYVLFVLSLLVVYGAFPTALIYKIPIFSFNPWGRLVSVTDFAIVIVAAITLEQILVVTSLKKRPFRVFLIVVLLAGGQFVNQYENFRKFAGPVKSSWFYPLTPILSEVQNNLVPLQSVIAERAFFISGSLGAYGIPEWFSHSTFTNVEKSLLSQLVTNPWATPFASYIQTKNINVNSPLLNAFGVRYVLGLSQSSRVKEDSFSEVELEIGKVSRFSFLLKKGKDLLGISIPVVQSQNSKLKFSLYSVSGKILEQRELNQEGTLSIKFPKGLRPSEEVYLELTLLEGSMTLSAAEKSKHLKRLNLSYSYSDFSAPHMVLRKIDGKNILYENMNAPQGAYFISSLTEKPHQIITKNIDTDVDENFSVTVKYSGDKNGFVVLPIKFYQQWSVTSQGNSKDIVKYLDVFPAVAVKPGETLHFVTQSKLGDLLDWVCLFFGGLFTLSFFIYRRKLSSDKLD